MQTQGSVDVTNARHLTQDGQRRRNTAHNSPNVKGRGKNIYLSSRIDGAIEVLKKNKEKDQIALRKKQEEEALANLPDPKQVAL